MEGCQSRWKAAPSGCFPLHPAAPPSTGTAAQGVHSAINAAELTGCKPGISLTMPPAAKSQELYPSGNYRARSPSVAASQSGAWLLHSACPHHQAGNRAALGWGQILLSAALLQGDFCACVTHSSVPSLDELDIASKLSPAPRGVKKL